MKRVLLSMVLAVCMSLSPLISTTSSPLISTASHRALPCDECGNGTYVWGDWYYNSAAGCEVRHLYCNNCGHVLDYEIRAID